MHNTATKPTTAHNEIVESRTPIIRPKTIKFIVPSAINFDTLFVVACLKHFQSDQTRYNNMPDLDLKLLNADIIK